MLRSFFFSFLNSKMKSMFFVLELEMPRFGFQRPFPDRNCETAPNWGGGGIARKECADEAAREGEAAKP